MTSKEQLTDYSLIRLLEERRSTFTDGYCPLLTAQETALQKAIKLVEEPRESLKRNYSRQKANAILNDIKKCVSPEVFVLCALATTHSALGTGKLGEYVSTIERWWAGAYHPKGLTTVSEKYGLRISDTLVLVRSAYQGISEDGQHANQSYSEHQSLIDDSAKIDLSIHTVVQRPRKRRRASIDNVYPEHVSGATDSLRPERSEALTHWRRLDAPLNSDEEISEISQVYSFRCLTSTVSSYKCVSRLISEHK